MKKILLILGVFAGIAASHITAQETEGVITYEVKINIHRNLPKDRQEMKGMVPEYNTTTEQLFYNGEESLYKAVQEEPEPGSGDEHGIHMRIRRPKREVYIHRAEFKRIALQEFMGKKYLIEDTLRMRPWKISSELTEIHGYSCRKATLFDESRKMNIVAWYSDQFRPFLGPENFNTLPGVVLLVDINDGERIITAKNIEFRPLQKNEMKIPHSKNKTTEAEYRKMVKEQMERTRAHGGNMIIRH